jgi:hypothetical protein
VSNSGLAFLSLALILAGCRRAEEPKQPELAVPEPAVTSPLASSGTFTNEGQAAFLQGETERLGIERLGKPSDGRGGPEEIREPITPAEGMARTRAMTAQFAARRRAIDRGREKTVNLPGQTPGLLGAGGDGRPLETAGSKDP